MPDLLSYAEVQKLLKDLPAEQKKLADDLIPGRGHRRHRPARAAGPAQGAGLDPRPAGHPGRHRRGRAALQPGHQAWSSRSARAWPASSASRTAPTTAPLPIITLSPRLGGAPSPTPWSAPARRSSWPWPRRGLQEFIRGVRESLRARGALAGEHGGAADQPAIRPYVRSIVERFRGQTVVMSQNEIHPQARLRTIGIGLAPHFASLRRSLSAFSALTMGSQASGGRYLMAFEHCATEAFREVSSLWIPQMRAFARSLGGDAHRRGRSGQESSCSRPGPPSSYQPRHQHEGLGSS